MIALTTQDRCPTYTAEQLYAIEQRWFAAGNPSFGLMQQAAWQMANWLLASYPDADTIGICVGGGNNGGDGWLIGCYCQQAGRQVVIVPAAEAATPDSQQARAQAIAAGVSVDAMSATDLFPVADIYVDALFGIGLDRQPSGHYAELITALNAQSAPVIAVDVPSGLVSDTGQIFFGIAVQAAVTLCLIALKVGLVMSAGKDISGDIIVLPLMPLPEDNLPVARWRQDIPTIPVRRHHSNKGTYGHAAIIGGNLGMSGAAILAAEAALRIGAGKVTAIIAADAQPSLLSRCPNVMTAELADLADLDVARERLSGMTAVAVGMGLGRDANAEAMMTNVLRVCSEAAIPVIMDADALYHLSSLTSRQHPLPTELLRWHTPHPGEAAYLLGVSISDIEQDRLAAIRALQQRYGGVWLLKGAGSLVIDETEQISLCGRGNPGMATAGAGDVLAGMAAGWLSQSPCDAHLIDVVLLHAAAGDRAAEHYGETSLLASDIMTMLPRVLAVSG